MSGVGHFFVEDNIPTATSESNLKKIQKKVALQSQDRPED